MHERKGFWDKNAGRYDRFMRKDRAAYEKMYELIRPVVKAKTVLEVATGTGLIAKSIVDAAVHIEATDASAKMILEAEEAGCKAIGGAGMLLQQGAVNYELFVGKEMPLAEYQEFQKAQAK